MPIKIKVSDLLGQHKMSMKQLSELTGIRPNTISNLYHEDIKRIEIAQIEALCKAFHCREMCIRDSHTADHRIGADAPRAAFCQIERAAHESLVIFLQIGSPRQ